VYTNLQGWSLGLQSFHELQNGTGGSIVLCTCSSDAFVTTSTGDGCGGTNDSGGAEKSDGGGKHLLCVVDLATGNIEPLDIPGLPSAINEVAVVSVATTPTAEPGADAAADDAAAGDVAADVTAVQLAVIAGGPRQSTAVFIVDIELSGTKSSGTVRLLRDSFQGGAEGGNSTGGNGMVDPGYLPSPTHIEYPTDHGLTAHAFFYPPVFRTKPLYIARISYT
jgi:hypothetical protein